ncbi:hypothetical protein B0H13DRAFT_1936338 [Mycena leptocephala]|nr:hypothetical protein B0H13DRAFT_1936338 [Mycena leptocephala]
MASASSRNRRKAVSSHPPSAPEPPSFPRFDVGDNDSESIAPDDSDSQKLGGLEKNPSPLPARESNTLLELPATKHLACRIMITLNKAVTVIHEASNCRGIQPSWIPRRFPGNLSLEGWCPVWSSDVFLKNCKQKKKILSRVKALRDLNGNPPFHYGISRPQARGEVILVLCLWLGFPHGPMREVGHEYIYTVAESFHFMRDDHTAVRVLHWQAQTQDPQSVKGLTTTKIRLGWVKRLAQGVPSIFGSTFYIQAQPNNIPCLEVEVRIETVEGLFNFCNLASKFADYGERMRLADERDLSPTHGKIALFQANLDRDPPVGQIMADGPVSAHLAVHEGPLPTIIQF